MKRLLLLLPLIFFAVCDGAAQIEGKWYTFSRNNVIEFTIRKDSIINRRLFWDLSPNIYSRNYYRSIAIVNSRVVNDKFYYAVGKSREEEEEQDGKADAIHFTVFQVTHPGKELYLFGDDTTIYTGPSSMDRFIASDTARKSLLIFISQSEIDRLKKLPSITTMNVADCKLYCEKIKKMQEEMVADSADLGLSYGYFRIRYGVSEVGYSPLYTNEQFEAWFKRFQTDPATKDLFADIFKE